MKQFLQWPGRAGLGSSPGWGPVRVGARSGLGPIWALLVPYVSSWTSLGKLRKLSVNFP